MKERKIIGIFLVIIGLSIILHHFILWGRIVDLEDMLHHEYFEAIFLTAGTTLVISEYYKNKTQSAER